MSMTLDPRHEARIEHLLQRAEGGQWDPNDRLDWRAPLALDQVSVAPPLISAELAGRWSTLARDDRAEAVRMLLGSLLGNLAVGEVFVDDTLCALKELLPNARLGEVVAWQIRDEVRHAQVLERYVQKIGWDPRTREAAASRLAEATITARQRWDTGSLLVMVLEIAATAAIQGLRTYCDEPLTHALLKGVVQDESRHISGMTLAVRAWRDEMDEDTLERLRDTAILGWHQALAVTEGPACEMSDALDAAFAAPRATPTTSWPFFRKTLADILVPKLGLLGLMNDDLAARLRDAGCPVPNQTFDAGV